MLSWSRTGGDRVARIQRLADDLVLIDTDYQRSPESIAVYLLLGDRPALIETGPASTVETVLQGVRAAGLDPPYPPAPDPLWSADLGRRPADAIAGLARCAGAICGGDRRERMGGTRGQCPAGGDGRGRDGTGAGIGPADRLRSRDAAAQQRGGTDPLCQPAVAAGAQQAMNWIEFKRTAA